MAKFEGSAKISKKKGDTSINVSLGKKGFFERLSEMSEKSKKCDYCGKNTENIIANCQYEGFLGSTCHPKISGYIQLVSVNTSTRLCKDCAKKCNKCGKYFCPTHLKKHKCT